MLIKNLTPCGRRLTSPTCLSIIDESVLIKLKGFQQRLSIICRSQNPAHHHPHHHHRGALSGLELCLNPADIHGLAVEGSVRVILFSLWSSRPGRTRGDGPGTKHAIWRFQIFVTRQIFWCFLFYSKVRFPPTWRVVQPGSSQPQVKPRPVLYNESLMAALPWKPRSHVSQIPATRINEPTCFF